MFCAVNNVVLRLPAPDELDELVFLLCVLKISAEILMKRTGQMHGWMVWQGRTRRGVAFPVNWLTDECAVANFFFFSDRKSVV